MFMITLKRTGLRRAGALALCGAVLAGAVLAGRLSAGQAVSAGAAVQTSIESTQDIQNYFAGYGLETDPAGITADKVKVPKKWDDSFTAFNQVVAQSGLDLSACKGKTVEKWLAEMPALSTGGQTMYGVLLVYEKKAVGAYLLEKPSGNVKGLGDVTGGQGAASSSTAAAAAGADGAADPAAEVAAGVDEAASPAAAGADAALDPAAEADAALDVDLALDGDGYPVE